MKNLFENECKISNPFYSSKKSSTKFKLRSINEKERMQVLKAIVFISLPVIFPELDEMYALNFNTVLADFIKYVEEIKKNQVNDIIKFKEDLKKWGLKYLKLDPSKTHEFTPYVHTFVHHIDELISLHKNIHLYNLQGLENLNSFVKKSYHNSTNKAKLDKAFLLQLLKIRNRIDCYNLNLKETEITNLNS